MQNRTFFVNCSMTESDSRLGFWEGGREERAGLASTEGGLSSLCHLVSFVQDDEFESGPAHERNGAKVSMMPFPSWN